MPNPYHEPPRPQFHFTAERGWLNDPNGLVFYKGEYHLFFQHNPHDVQPANMTWGHAISPDLLHWRQLPNAIEPDEFGDIWSGSAVVDWPNSAGLGQGSEETLVAIYTAAGGVSPRSAGQPFTQRIAYSNDRGRTWTKYHGNPVLGQIVGGNRDPKVTWHSPTNRWVMALYLTGNEFALFTSPDLKRWQQIQTLTLPGSEECPDFFEMPVDGDPGNARWVFTAANGRYLVGRFDGRVFTPESGPHPADAGANFYAVQTFSDIPPMDGRRIQMAWMRGGSYPGMPFNQQMSFPCELTLHQTPDGYRLRRRPVEEIARLRRVHHALKNAALGPGELSVPDAAGDLFDVELAVRAESAAQIALEVRGVRVEWHPSSGTVSCLGRSMVVEPTEGGIALRVLVDRTSAEVFSAQSWESLSSCYLPQQCGEGVRVRATGGTATILSLDVWELESIWP